MIDYVKNSREHFDKQAAEYDSNTSYYYSGPAKVSSEYVLAFLALRDYASLLDVGCGTGFLIDNLSKQKKAMYFGLDLSGNMVAVAKGKNIEGAIFVQGVADNLPYPDDSFDIVTCIQSFHHYPDQDKAMKEAFRVLKPGGTYLLSDTGIGGLGALIDNHLIFKFLKSGDCHTDNRKGISRRMAKNGFINIQSEQIKGFIYTVIGYKPDKAL